MKQIFILFIVTLVYHLHIHTNTLTLFFRSYGISAEKIPQEKLQSIIAKPGKLGRYLLKQQMKKQITQGICATYMGDFAISNIDGSLSFVRKTARNVFYILVTRMIKPVMLLGATVHHFTISDNEPYAFYKCTYTSDDTSSTFYWKIEKDILPENKAIPLNTIIIFARPQALILPEGASIVQKQLQLVFPDILVTSDIDRIGNSLRLVAIQHFFSRVRINQKIPGKKHEINVISD